MRVLRARRRRGARPDALGQRRAGRRVPRPGDDHAVHPRDLRGRRSTCPRRVSSTRRCSPTISTPSSTATASCGVRRSSKARSGRRRIAFVEAPGGIRLEFMEQLEPAPRRPMTFTPYDRPVRAAFVGLGRIYDLNVRAYVDNPDVEVVALVDPSEERREAAPARLARSARRSPRPPSSRRAASRSMPSRRCCRSRCTSTASSSCSTTGGTSTCRSRCATTSPSAERMLDAAPRQRPGAAGHGELPVLRAAAEAQGHRRVRRAR